MSLRAIWAAAAVLAAGTLTGIGLPAPVQASTEDEAFVETLDRGGMQYGDREKAIMAAKVYVCDQLQADPDETFADVVSTVAENTNWSDDDSAFFAGAAIGVYCPQYGNLANPNPDPTPTPVPDGTDV